MPIIYEQEPVFEGAERVSVRQYAQSIRGNERMRSAGGEQVALALEHIGSSVNAVMNALGQTVNGVFDEITVTDAETGAIIGWIGTNAGTGAQGGWFRELYVGGDDPTSAPLIADASGRVTLTLGTNDDQAFLAVLDSSDNQVVWMGQDNGEYGIWAKNVWIGGTEPADAVLWSDGTGTYIGNGYVVVLDDTTPDPLEVAWIGVRTFGNPPDDETFYGGGFENIYVGPGADPRTAPFFCNGTDVVIGQNGHIVVLDDTTPTPLEVGWFGVREFSSTMYYGGHVVEWRIAGDITDPTTALFVADAAGLMIGDAAGSRMEVDPSGNLSIIDAELTITDAPVLIEINALDGVKVSKTDLSPVRYAQLQDGQVTVTDGVAEAVLSSVSLSVEYQSGGARVSNAALSSGGRSIWYDDGGVERARIDAPASGGYGNFPALRVGNTERISNAGIGKFASLEIAGLEVIDSSRNADFASLVLTTDLAIADGGTGASSASAARTNLDVYSKAEVDALVGALSFASSTHTHVFTGSPVGSHTHSGAVVADGGHTPGGSIGTPVG